MDLQSPSRAITATVLETRGMALETSHGVCCTQWLRCLQDKGDHVSGANSNYRAASWIEGQHSPTNVDVGTDPAGQVC